MRRLPGLLLCALLLAALPACHGSGGTAAPTETRELAYAALGASDAVGYWAVPLSSGYAFLLRDRMTAAGFQVRFDNFGVNGARADDIAAQELPAAVAADPDVVTLWAGANDLVDGRSPELFAAQLDAILAGLRSRTRAQVFVGDLPDLTRAPRFLEVPDPDVTRARLDAFNRRIRSTAAARGCVLVPLASLPTDAPMFSIDGFHPSNLGHSRIAERFWAAISARI